MKKLFTLIATIAASVGILQAQQVTLTWSLTESGENQLNGVSTNENVTISGVTPGANITVGAVKKYTEGSGTLFSPNATFDKSTPQEGYNVVFSFEVSSQYSFKPSSLSFFSAADGSGNKHLLAATISDDSSSDNIVTDYQLGRGSSNAETTTHSISSDKVYEGPIDLTFDLYGKPGGTNKGWSIGDVVLIGELISKSDDRTTAPISWNPENVTIKIRDQFTAPVLTNSEDLPVTFSSNNESLAKVSDTGVITLEEGVLGTAIITATYDGSSDNALYKTTNVNTTITVNTNVTDVYVWEEYPAVESIALDNIWQADKTAGVLDANSSLLSDENIEITTVFDAKYSNYANNYLGYDFKGAAQLSRVDAAPTEDVKTGTEKADNSPLIVTPEKDLQLVMFFRRQGIEVRSTDDDNETDNVITRTHYIGMKADDGKGVVASAHSDIKTSIYPELVFGKTLNAAKGDDYLTCAAIFDLKAGETYTIWARGTTISLNGIGYVLPEVLIESISISCGEETNVTEITMTEEDTLQFKAAVLPEDATVSTVTWSVSDTDLAKIEVNPETPNTVTLTALGVGEVTLTATADDDSEVKAEVTVTIEAKVIEVASITLSGYDGTPITPGETVKFTATVLPEDATVSTVAWSVSNTDLAAIEVNPETPNTVTLTALGVGEVTLTATADDDSEVKAEVTVTIEAKVIEVTSITLSGYDGTPLAPEATVQLIAVITPEDATNKEVTWSSSDESVVTVSDEGLVTAIEDGKATITVTSVSNPEVSASCEIIVDKSSVILNIAADANGEFNVYDINGRLVIKTREASKVVNLNKGIYIINGKKVVVK